MIVVVIMGILIAVAIPLYGAITKNANNKTCGTNIKNIKSNAATYASTYNTNVTSLAELKSMFDDGNMPECPLSKDGVYDDYSVAIAANGAAEVHCKNVGTDGHAPDGDTTLTGTALS